MKFTHIGSASSGRLEFNDLGTVVKGSVPQQRFIMLDPGESVYLPDGQDVMSSVIQGDAKKYAAAGLLRINDTIAIGATSILAHNFGYIPSVTVAKLDTTWKAALVGTDFTASTNTAKTETTIVNLSGKELNVRLS